SRRTRIVGSRRLAACFRTIGQIFPTIGEASTLLKRVRSQQERRSTLKTITNSVVPGHEGDQHLALPPAAALLQMKADSESQGSTCALLTPAIKSKLRELDSGQVLEVRVSDSTAREDIAAWCRLSGNELLAMLDDGHQGLRFFLKKK
ncbi:MAG: sulfurtransferase TusA family protein, partial [Spirochaetia bacterium]